MLLPLKMAGPVPEESGTEKGMSPATSRTSRRRQLTEIYWSFRHFGWTTSIVLLAPLPPPHSMSLLCSCFVSFVLPCQVNADRKMYKEYLRRAESEAISDLKVRTRTPFCFWPNTYKASIYIFFFLSLHFTEFGRYVTYLFFRVNPT